MISSLSMNAASASTGGLPPTNPHRIGDVTEQKRLQIDIVASIRRHWLISLTAFFVVLGCGGFILWKKDRPVYEAHSVIYVSPKFPKILATDNEVDLPYDSYFEDQLQWPTRYDIVEGSIATLPEAIRHRTGEVLPYEISVLQKALEVKRIGFTYEMSIGLTGRSPDGLAEIVNSVSDTYVEKAKNEEFYGRDDRLNTLRQEQERLKRQMDDRLAEQAQLMRQLGMATLASGPGAINPYDSTSQSVRTQLATARMDREAAEARYQTLVQGDGSVASGPSNAAADDALAGDSSSLAARSNLSTRRATLLDEMNGMRPDNPIYKKDKQELASIDHQLGDLAHDAGEHLQAKLRQDVTRTRMVELQLIKELGENTRAAAAAAPKLQLAAELGPEIESLQRAFDAVDDRIRELELESNSPGSIHVATKALTPLGPKPSKLRLLLLALLFVSMGCAAASSVAIDLLDDKIYTARDVERIVSFHPLGILLNDDEFCHEISDEYYFRLAAGVEHALRKSGVRTFLFTAAAHGCGTTTVVKKLDERLRELKLRTRTITVSSSDDLGISRSDALSRSSYLLESRIRTDELQGSPPAGLAATYNFGQDAQRRGEHIPTPVLQSLHQSAELCDVLLIDANPLPISATTEYFARLADATVIVVGSGTTTKKELDRAARLLERLEVAGVAVVLNKTSRDRADRASKIEFNRFEQSLRTRGSETAQAGHNRIHI